MKLSTITTKLRKYFNDREFLKYTGQFLLMMMIIYLFSILSLGIQSPTFTYSVF
ncbi:MAG: hypothetical protein I3I98_08725 [Mobilibacterium timonense]|uniref:hypothetical protein n=1 Tax=Mobilibacterium timonense TaxID=1871012 RepID=UPI00235344F7|nr:hypothetical protein [Mobilibacterium timonense]MBM6991453.1 hypothetical protein [Mobilibacterium timonense]